MAEAKLWSFLHSQNVSQIMLFYISSKCRIGVHRIHQENLTFGMQIFIPVLHSIQQYSSITFRSNGLNFIESTIFMPMHFNSLTFRCLSTGHCSWSRLSSIYSIQCRGEGVPRTEAVSQCPHCTGQQPPHRGLWPGPASAAAPGSTLQHCIPTLQAQCNNSNQLCSVNKYRCHFWSFPKIFQCLKMRGLGQ